MKKKTLIYILLFLFGITLSLFVAFSNINNLIHWFNIDDGFFYFKVARNVAHGQGFTFDGINRTNGFHPLWMAVCTVVYTIFRTDLILPLRIIVIIGGILNGLSAIFLFKILTRVLNEWVAVTLAILWAVIPSITGVTTMQGMETGLSIFLLLLLIERAQAWFFVNTRPTIKQLFLFGIIAALAILARLDHIFYIALICLIAFFGWRFTNHKLVFDVIAITAAAVSSWLLTLKFGLKDFSDYTVFPLLFVSVLVIVPLLHLFKRYQQSKFTSIKDGLKGAALLLAAVLAIIPILYAINAFQFTIRFPKLLIILMVLLSTLFIGVNHALHGLFVAQKLSEKTKKLTLRQYVREALVMGSPLVVLIGGYLLFNLRYAGTLMPVSGKLKHFWSTLANPVYGKARNFLDVFGIGERVNPWRAEITLLQRGVERVLAGLGIQGDVYEEVLLFAVLAILLAGVLFLFKISHVNTLDKMNRLLFPALFIGSLLRVAYYSGWGYIAIRNWYWIIERLILLIFAALLLDVVAEKVNPFKAWRTIFGIVLALIVGVNLLNAAVKNRISFPVLANGKTGSEELDLLRLLDDATPPGSIIGMTGGGMQGYFTTDRTVVNLDGLINSQEYYQSMLDGTTVEFLIDMKLDYVYGNPYMLLNSDPYIGIFKDRVDPIKALSTSEDTYLYRFLGE